MADPKHYVPEFFKNTNLDLDKIEKEIHVYKTVNIETGEFYIGCATWDWDKKSRPEEVYSGSFTHEDWRNIDDNSVLRKEVLHHGFKNRKQAFKKEYEILQSVIDDPLNVNKKALDASPMAEFFDNGGYWKGKKRSKKFSEMISQANKGNKRPDTRKRLADMKKANIKEYKKDPSYCKQCGKELPYSKRRHKTCSQKCKGDRLSEVLTGLPRDHGRAVRCKCHNKEFDKIRDCADFHNMKPSNVEYQLRTGKLKRNFEYLNTELEARTKKRIKESKSSGDYIKHLETGKVYTTVKSASDDTGRAYSTVFYHLNRHKNPDFVYVEEKN